MVLAVIYLGELKNCYVCDASRLTLSASFHNTHSHPLTLIHSSNMTITCQTCYNASVGGLSISRTVVSSLKIPILCSVSLNLLHVVHGEQISALVTCRTYHYTNIRFINSSTAT